MKKRRRLWYTSPAKDWETQALPIGNGILGGMIFGEPYHETIQYNHKELWSGGPGEWEDYKLGIREGAAAHLPSIRAKLARGRVNEANQEIDEYLLGEERAFGSYQNFGNITIAMQGSGEVSGYERSLDLEEGIAYVKFECEGVRYERSYFCSYPDRVMVVQLTADGQVMKDLVIAMDCPQNAVITYDKDHIMNRGKVIGNGMRFTSKIQILSEDGDCQTVDGGIQVSGAKSVTLFVTAGTDYKNEYPHYKGEDPTAEVEKTLADAVIAGYKQVRANHLEDYKALFDRVTF
ncbi:MAG: glycoside hydrolase family 95 protein, partial [Cellulosilyticaceae bacterium]